MPDAPREPGPDSIHRIAHFLPGLEGVFADGEVSEIMINGPGGAWVERGGSCEWVAAPELTARRLESAAVRIARPLRQDISAERPIVDARLPDGSRVAIAVPPVAPTATITIRRFGRRQFSAETLAAAGSLPREVLAEVGEGLRRGRNVLVSGGTGSGKTTMLGAFLGLVPRRERVLVIEDVAELQADLPNLVRFEAAGVTIRELVRHALRHRPDRIVVGEVRGGEASDLLDALSTGHGGSLSTIHANGAVLALTRLAVCVLQGCSEGQSMESICQRVVHAVDFVVHVERDAEGRRGVVEAVEVEGYDLRSAAFSARRLWPPPGCAVGPVGAREGGEEPIARLEVEERAAERRLALGRGGAELRPEERRAG